MKLFHVLCDLYVFFILETTASRYHKYIFGNLLLLETPVTTKPNSQTQKTSSSGMTAAMLAALATSASSASGISEQKRLLLELEKKVEEQKKLIEMQKVLFLVNRMEFDKTRWSCHGIVTKTVHKTLSGGGQGGGRGLRVVDVKVLGWV